jgi:hypothetical protein
VSFFGAGARLVRLPNAPNILYLPDHLIERMNSVLCITLEADPLVLPDDHPVFNTTEERGVRLNAFRERPRKLCAIHTVCRA